MKFSHESSLPFESGFSFLFLFLYAEDAAGFLRGAMLCVASGR